MKKNKVKGLLNGYLTWPLILIMLFAIMTIHMFIINIQSGSVAFIYFAVYAAIAVFLYNYKTSAILSNIVNFANDYNLSQTHLLKKMDIPYANISISGNILWANDAFSEATGYTIKGKRSHSLTSILPDITPELFPKPCDSEETPTSVIPFKLGDRYFKAVLKLVSIHTFDFANDEDNIALFDNSDSYIALYLYDETQLKEYIAKSDDEDIVMGLLYIDNYEDSLANCDDTQRSLLLALVERQIAKSLQQFDAIYRKIEKDRYFFIFRKKYLDVAESGKFSILEDVRNVTVGKDNIHVTISIGIGLNADTYAKRYEYARTAIDLALGRGGNQAVVKNHEDISYYGGKTVQKESYTRVRARVKAHALNELILASEQIFIMGHKNADIDSFGAAVGIYRIARTLEHNAQIVIDREDCKSLDAVLERYANNSYYDDFLITSEEALKSITPNALLVIVDVNLAHLTQCPELLELTKNIVVIDHHRQNGQRIENQILSYVEPFSSSACEMVTEFFQYINDGIKPRPLEADTLYSGIMVDTNNFSTQTNVRTFEAVAYLKRNGVDITRVRKMFRSKPSEYLLRAQAVSNAEIYKLSYAITILPTEDTTLLTPATGAKVANSLLDMDNIKASFVCFPYKSQIYINARSIDEVNVQLIMERMGGGGHVSVAATQLDCTIEEAVTQLKDTLDIMIKEGEI